MSHKIERLEAAIQKGIQQVLAKGLADPRVRGLVTVTSVRVLPDLTEAHVSISVFPDKGAELTFHGVESSARYIRREVGKLVDTRQLPTLRFTLDDSLKKQAAVLKAIEAAAGDLRKREDEGRAEKPAVEEPES